MRVTIEMSVQYHTMVIVSSQKIIVKETEEVRFLTIVKTIRRWHYDNKK